MILHCSCVTVTECKSTDPPNKALQTGRGRCAFYCPEREPLYGSGHYAPCGLKSGVFLTVWNFKDNHSSGICCHSEAVFHYHLKSLIHLKYFSSNLPPVFIKIYTKNFPAIKVPWKFGNILNINLHMT